MKLATYPAMRQFILLKDNAPEALLVALLLLLGLLVRYIPPDHVVPYEWEQARDAWAVKQIIVDGERPLIGPRVAINDFHLGPLYFYVLSAYYLATDLDPIGASYFVMTAYFAGAVSLYLVGRWLFGIYPSLIALSLYVVSYFQILSDKPPWNVSLVIPVTVWLFYALWRLWQKEKTWILALSIFVGIMLHVHITVLFFMPTIAYVLWRARTIAGIWRYTAGGIGLVIASMSPLIFYEVYSGFQNILSLTYFLKQDTQMPHILFAISKLSDVFFMFEALFHIPWFAVLSFVAPISFWVFVRSAKKESVKYLHTISAFVFITTWIFLMFYSNTIFEYYFLILAPIVYYMTAVTVYILFTHKYEVVRIATIILCVGWIASNIHAVFTASDIKGLDYEKKLVQETIDRNEQIEFNEGEIQSYLYWYYAEKDN